MKAPNELMNSVCCALIIHEIALQLLVPSDYFRVSGKKYMLHVKFNKLKY